LRPSPAPHRRTAAPSQQRQKPAVARWYGGGTGNAAAREYFLNGLRCSDLRRYREPSIQPGL